MNNDYCVLNINAYDLIQLWKSRGRKSPKGKISYVLDLSLPEIQALCQTRMRSGNALFDQIKKCDNTTAGKHKELMQKIIFLDFHDIFDDNKSDLNDPYLVQLLSPNSGITITYPNKKIKFVPFDRSANMSRNSRISYIETGLKKELDHRLNLDINFSSILMHPSKYYAYRGLYLTTSRRIDSEKLVLNQNTVVVLPDCAFTPQEDFNGKPTVLTDCDSTYQGATPLGSSFYAEQKTDIETNAFDGEGLISPNYAELINRELNKNASSYQIRLPFCKGVLHKVDFDEFLKENSAEHRIIKDYFGIDRELDSAEIILTESMFKAKNWLKQYCAAKKIPDPMKFYFDKTHEYEHALYVSSTDASIYSTGTDRLNYQFLDTLALSREDFYALIEEHYQKGYADLKEKFKPLRQDGKGELSNSAQRYIDKTSPLGKILAALGKNDAFYAEPQLITRVQQALKNLRTECGRGLLRTEGEHRFLSADLLAFLYYVLWLTSKDPADFAEFLKNKPILQNNCFLAAPAVKGDYYTLLRSPHLSRNEEVLLKSYVPNDNGDLYSKYFGHLKGIAMIPITSLTAALLGGADFDGDSIKLLTNAKIIEAIKVGAYDENYKRHLPIVVIPSKDTNDNRTTLSKSDFVSLIKNTFSSKTGLISNLSVYLADAEYNPDEMIRGSEFKENAISNCALTTIVTGLEIDSCKRGKSPEKEIEGLQVLAKETEERLDKEKAKAARQFIKWKELFKRIGTTNYRVTKRGDKEEYDMVIYKYGERGLNCWKPSAKQHNILALPYAFASHTYNDDDQAIIYGTDSIPNSGILKKVSSKTDPFIFDTAFSLDEEKLKKVRQLVIAYHRILRDIPDYGRSIQTVKSSKVENKLNILLTLKYDDIDSKLDEYGKSVTELIDDLKSGLSEFLGDINKVDTALSDVENLQWIYTKKEKRRDTLKKILGANTEQLCLLGKGIDLLTDFNGNGFLILPYVLKLIRKDMDIALEQTNRAAFIARHSKTKKTSDRGNSTDENEYYERLLSLYNKDGVDDDYDPYEIYDDTKDSDGQDYNFNRELIDESLKELCLIVGCSGKTRTEKQHILQYVCATRKKEDKNGRFFWDVLPLDFIIDNIKIEKGETEHA